MESLRRAGAAVSSSGREPGAGILSPERIRPWKGRHYGAKGPQGVKQRNSRGNESPLAPAAGITKKKEQSWMAAKSKWRSEEGKPNGTSTSSASNAVQADTPTTTKRRSSETGPTSSYRGVCWVRQTGKWRSILRHAGDTFCLGSYATEEEAARAHDAKARELQGLAAPLNFPDDAPDPSAIKKRKMTSTFKGVSWHKHKCRWRAVIWHSGKTQSLGYFTSEEGAAHAYDSKARELLGDNAQLNFPS